MIPVLSVTGLKVSIRTDDGPARVLDDVGLTLWKGRILGVVGESGCGKSTLIRAIMGILPRAASVDAGTISFEGENLLVFSEAELNQRIRGSRIGFIPQDPLLSLNPVFKVGTQMLEIMRDHAPGSRRDHVKRLVTLLHRLRLPDPRVGAGPLPAPVLRRPAPAPADRRGPSPARPGLLIADEPTTALDVTTQHEILLLLRELADEFALSLLFVTHDLGVVAELCDDLTVIYAGQTIEAGPVRQILRAPTHPYTRALMACHPERATSFVGIPGTVPSAVRMPSGCPLRPALRRGRADLPHRLAASRHMPRPGANVRCIHAT